MVTETKQNKVVENKVQTTKVNEQVNNTWDVVAWITPVKIFNKETGKYTDEESQHTCKVVITGTNEVLGYITYAQVERFMSGEIKAVPVKMPKKEN